MICLYCDSTTSKVVDSREISKGIRRRRECLMCNKRFTTYETIQTKSVIVTKSDGTLKEFGTGKNKSVFPFWLCVLLLAMLSYYVCKALSVLK